MDRIFSTLSEAVETVREALGEHAGDHDVEAIARAAFEYQGTGFVQVLTGDDFWAVVAEHAGA